ncbi:MAG TPA: DUF4340 domain-containing protein [archaeon]|nr:DUF4340 domain-containing protein [archaeon]
MNRLAKPLIVLIVLLAIWLVIRFTGHDTSRPHPEISLKVDLNPDKINRIEISRGQEQIIILHGTTGWQVKTPAGIKPADSEQVLSALSNFNKVNTADIVSHNPEKHAEYKVDSAGGTRVRIYGQGDVALDDILIGKLGGFESQQMAAQRGRVNERDFYTFMRRESSDQVFKVQGFFGGMLGTDPEQWRDHNLMSFRPGQAWKLSFIHPDERVVIEKDTSRVWVMLEPELGAPGDSAEIKKIIGTLSTLRASGFVDSTLAPQALGLDPPSFSVRVELKDSTTYEVSVGNELENNLFYCRKPGDEQVYTIAAFRLDQIKKRAYALIEKGEGEKKE